MPPFRFLPGPDEMAIPAYVVTDANDAGLDAWKAEHPDWFVAGHWTPPGPDRRPPPFAGRGPGTTSRHRLGHRRDVIPGSPPADVGPDIGNARSAAPPLVRTEARD